MIELAKMAWSPVLELLGKEIRFEELDKRPYTIREEATFPQRRDTGSRSILQADRSEEWRWLSPADIVAIHDEMIATFGREKGILDFGRVESALDLAFASPVAGHDPFPTLIEKAASVLHSILVYHPFVDGQKRTGISTAFMLLGVNGYYLWSRDTLDEVHFAIHVAKGEFEVAEIARWIRARVASPDILDDPQLVEALLPFAERKSRQCSVCHRPVRLERFRVQCRSCGAEYVVRLNAALVQRGKKGARFFVQPGMTLVSGRRFVQRTLF